MSGNRIVLSLCDRTGNMVKPWADAGYICWCLDIQHSNGTHTHGNIVKIGADILTWRLPVNVQYAIVFAFPPCTHLAVSGARWFKGKGLNMLASAIRLVARCAEIADQSNAPWMLENPVGVLSTHWRKPDYSFDPSDYAGYLDDPAEDAYTKKTCLWTGNNFVIPDKRPILPYKGSKMHRLPPSLDRANIRSETPNGFAKAVFIANHLRCARADN